MSVLLTLCHPITVAFFVITIGLCIGKVKICGISLDLAAVLIVAVTAGYFISLTNGVAVTEQLNSYMKMFSTLGTSLFVSVIGITAGYSLNTKSDGKLSSAVVGMSMIISAFAVMWIISKIDIGVSYSNLLGVLCGALTTTPGLSAVCEKSGVVPEEASLGYGSAYLFGVIFTVLTVQIITRKADAVNKAETCAKPKPQNKAIFGGLLQISTVIVLGRVLGELTVPYINFSLGNSGGMLCSGIFIGGLIGKHLKSYCILKEQQSIVRNLGLILFFVGNGIPAGMQINNNFSALSILIGILLTVIPITVGWFICKVILRKSNKDTAAIISGGMTSTPAIGVLNSKTDVAYDKYSFSYVGALITIILLLNLEYLK